MTYQLGRSACACLALGVTLLAPVVSFADSVTVTNLTSDGSVPAAFTDPNLVNPWGITYGSSGPFWVSDNGTGKATVYSGTGMPSSTIVTLPVPAGQTTPAAPTGQVFNATTSFAITSGGKTKPATFLFDTEDGTISGWNPAVSATSAVIAVDNSASGAVYKGLAQYSDSTGDYLLAANFNSGQIEVYDSSFTLVRMFRDKGSKLFPAPPPKYAPFNVAVLNGSIYATYALQGPGAHDDVPGQGHGFLDEFTIEGALVARIASHGPLNSPWGMATAPASFGKFAGTLLVGNFGNGWINGFQNNGGIWTWIGHLGAATGGALAIDGLWGLIPGNGGQAGVSTELYFTSGPNKEVNGLFGSLTYKVSGGN